MYPILFNFVMETLPCVKAAFTHLVNGTFMHIRSSEHEVPRAFNSKGKCRLRFLLVKF